MSGRMQVVCELHHAVLALETPPVRRALWDAVEVSVSGFCLTPGPYTTYGGMLKQPDKQEAPTDTSLAPAACLSHVECQLFNDISQMRNVNRQ